MKTSTNIHIGVKTAVSSNLCIHGVQLVATAAFDEFILDLEANPPR